MRLGLTGSFGSGKTTISNFFKDRGAIIIDADAIAHEIMQPGTDAFQAVIKTFGTQYLKSDGTLDRRKLGAYVFKHPEALERLEKIIHPLVRKREMELLEAYKDKPFVVLSVPLLYEKGLEKYVDKVAIVTISNASRYERLTKNYRLSREEIDERLKNQIPQEEKVQRSDFIIDNNGSLEQSRKQVDRLLEKLVHLNERIEGKDHAKKKDD